MGDLGNGESQNRAVSGLSIGFQRILVFTPPGSSYTGRWLAIPWLKHRQADPV